MTELPILFGFALTRGVPSCHREEGRDANQQQWFVVIERGSKEGERMDAEARRRRGEAEMHIGGVSWSWRTGWREG